MSDMQPVSRNAAGFTLIEIMTMAPLVLLLIGGVIAAMVHTTTEVISIRTKNTLVHNIQTALSQIEKDVEHSTGFLATTDTAFDIVSPQGYDNATQDFQNASANGTALLLVMPLTDKNPFDPTRELLRLADQPNPCASVDIVANSTMNGVIAYFVKDGSLWRRTLLPSNYESAGCGVPWHRPSCHPSQTDSFCKTEDVLLVETAAEDGFVTDYFSSASSTTPNSAAADIASADATRQAALNLTKSVHITITGAKSTGGQTITQSLETQVSRLVASF